jgi:hypothetical protein
MEDQLLKSEKNLFPRGNHEIKWKATENQLKPGMFIVSISGKNKKGIFKETQKVQLIK